MLARLSAVLVIEDHPVQWPLLPFDVLSMPEWSLPAFQECSSNPHTMFELARKMRSGGPELDKVLQVMKSAECSWDIPHGLFVRWLHQWLCRKPTRGDYHRQKLFEGGNVSCRLIKVKGLHGQEANFHFFPFLEKVNPRLDDPDMIAYQVEVAALIFSNTDKIDESIFAFRDWKELRERERIGTKRAARTSHGQIHVQGWDTEIPRDDLKKILPGVRRSPYSITPRRLLGSSMDTEQVKVDFKGIWEAIDYSLNPDPTTGHTVSLPL